MNDRVTQTKRDNTRIRRFRQDEIPFVRGRIMVEVPKLPQYIGITVDAKRIDEVLQMAIDHDNSFMARMLVNDEDRIVGGVSGYCVTLFLSYERMTNDVFFFIDPEYRSLPNAMKLMHAYRDWALTRGATIIAATQTGGVDPVGMDKLLRRIGKYEPVGTIYHYKPGDFTEELARLAS